MPLQPFSVWAALTRMGGRALPAGFELFHVRKADDSGFELFQVRRPDGTGFEDFQVRTNG